MRVQGVRTRTASYLLQPGGGRPAPGRVGCGGRGGGRPRGEVRLAGQEGVERRGRGSGHQAAARGRGIHRGRAPAPRVPAGMRSPLYLLPGAGPGCVSGGAGRRFALVSCALALALAFLSKVSLACWSCRTWFLRGLVTPALTFLDLDTIPRTKNLQSRAGVKLAQSQSLGRKRVATDERSWSSLWFCETGFPVTRVWP